jgi:hypothetical protein
MATSAPVVQGERCEHNKQAPKMSTAVAVFAILSATVTALGSLASLLWWAYRRGESAGEAKAERDAAHAEDKAKIETLEQLLTETRAELSALRPTRTRSVGTRR